MLEQAKSAVSIPMRIDHDKARALFRVWVGPIDSQVQQNNAVAALRASGVTDFTLVDLAH